MSASFKEALLAQRERVNAVFAQARHFRPDLDGNAFGRVLLDLVAPAADAAIDAGGDADAVTGALVALSLDLLGHGVLGPERNNRWVSAGWRALPAMAPALARAPQRLAAAMSNALINLAQTSGARPEQWLAGFVELARQTQDTDLLLRAGQALAWRAGMAHFRTEALSLLEGLPAPLAAVALGLPPATAPATLRTTLEQLKFNRWFVPGQNGGARRLRVVARIGGFRGFGGVFLTPPTVDVVDGALRARIGGRDGEAWTVFADAFGATFHRQPSGGPPTAASAPAPFSLNKGRIAVPGLPDATFPALLITTSAAAFEGTLAVTTPLSHAIWLIAPAFA